MNLTELIKLTYKYLSSNIKKKLIKLVIIMCIIPWIEAAVVGLITLYIATLNDPDIVFKSIYYLKMQAFVNGKGPNDLKELILILSIIIIAAVGIRNAILAFFDYKITEFSSETGSYFGNRLQKGIMGMPYIWHTKQNSADLHTAFLWRKTIGAILVHIMKIVKDGLMSFVLIMTIIIIHPVISICIFGSLGLSAVIILKKTRAVIYAKSEKVKNLLRSLNRDSLKGIHGAKDLIIYGKSSYLSALKADLKAFTRAEAIKDFMASIPNKVLELIGIFLFTSVVTTIIYITKSSSGPVITTLALIGVTAWRVLPAISSMVASISKVRGLAPEGSQFMRHFEIVDKNSEELNKNRKKREEETALQFNKSIKVHNISFSYGRSKDDVLNSIDFEIKAGDNIGIIGLSGSGKSTLVDLLIGLLQPHSGEIRIDDILLDDKTHSLWMNQIGYVSQNPYFSYESISENIAFGKRKDEIDIKRVISCCKKANVDEFLPSLPNGIDTLIGERGVALSGGQRQRIAIARALYREPKLLIFDEATSSLDMTNEKAIQDTIRNLVGKITIIIIAHRLSTVKNCERILWLSKGNIIMDGNPEKVFRHYEKELNNVTIV